MAQPGGLNLTSAAVAGLAQGAQTLGDVVISGDSAAASLYHYGVQGFDNIRSQYQPPSTHVRCVCNKQDGVSSVAVGVEAHDWLPMLGASHAVTTICCFMYCFSFRALHPFLTYSDACLQRHS